MRTLKAEMFTTHHTPWSLGMRFFVPLAVFFLCIAMRTPVSAQLLVEDFNYPAGDSLTAHGWVNYQTATTPLAVSAGNLSYTGYSSGVGNFVAVNQNFDTENVKRSFASQNSGAVYVSFLLKVVSALPSSYFGSGNAVQLGPTGMDAWSSGLLFYMYLDQGKLMFAISKTGSHLNLTDSIYDFNTPILIVLKYNFNPGYDNDDDVSIFVNPTLGGTEPSPTSIDYTGSQDAADISEIGIHGYDNDPDGPDVSSFIIDGLQVSTSWPTGSSSSLIFQDGFELGSTSSWSSTTP